MQQEHYQIQWTEYSDHFQNSLQSLMLSSELTDVTLVCDDKKVLKAHKLVLSSCSSVFKNIIQSMPENNSMIYLRGIKHQEMESILQYIYIGGAEVKKDKIEDFLNLAANLELAYFNKLGPNEERKGNSNESNCEIIVDVPANNEVTESDPNIRGEENKQKTKDFNISRQCPECETQFSMPGEMFRHFDSVHNQSKYKCHKCDHEFTSRKDLNIHVQANHVVGQKSEQKVHKCDQCTYTTKERGNWVRHRKIVHEGIKFDCSLCNHKASTTSHLKTHMLNKHLENMIFNMKEGEPSTLHL